MTSRTTCLALRLALGLAAATAGPAAAFTAWNGEFVRESAPGRFEVHWRGGASGAPEFWCAAGDYVMRGMGLPRQTRIWRVSPDPRRSGAPMEFALSPEGAVPSGLVVLWGDAMSRSASGARSFCDR